MSFKIICDGGSCMEWRKSGDLIYFPLPETIVSTETCKLVYTLNKPRKDKKTKGHVSRQVLEKLCSKSRFETLTSQNDFPL